MKQTVICVILQAFSQNCTVGLVENMASHLSGHVSELGEGTPLSLTACLPCVARPRSQASADR